MPHPQTLEVLLERLGATFQVAAIFLVIALLIYLPGRLLVLPGIRRLADALDVDENITLPLLKVVHAAVAVFALFVATALSGLASVFTATEAITAAATIALGFAAQDVLGNFVSGVFIVTDPKFNIGDWVQWNDREGIIEDISFRVTRVHTFDNELVTVPNAEFTKNAVTNPVAKDRLRVSARFGVGYGEDLDRVREILVEEAERHPEILDRPSARVQVEELGESAVIVVVRFWFQQPARTDFVRVRSEYVQTVKERFDAEGIEMPYPYQQLTGEVGVRDLPPSSAAGEVEEW